MNILEFKDQWSKEEKNLQPLSLKNLKELDLKQSTIDFLMLSGLPSDAAPFLSFVKDTDKDYEKIARLTEQYDFLEEEFDRYIVIGSDGAGNPIAIDTADNDKIVWLDHEDYFPSRFMNSSILALAQTLLVYRDFITEIITKYGEDAFLDLNFDDTQFENLQNSFSKIDAQATMQDNFWKDELNELLVNREYYRSQE